VLGGTPVLNAMSAWMIYWCVGNSTDKDNLWGTSTRRFGSLLGSNVNLGISMNGRKALKVEVFVKTTELKKMVESRPHVSTERSLLVSTTLGGRVVERILLFHGNTEVDGTDSGDSEHVEFLLLAFEHGFNFLNGIILTTGSNKVQNICRSIIVNLEEIRSENTENSVETVANSISGINNAEKSMANNTLGLRDISETKRPLALHFPINFVNFDIKDAMSTVYATNVNFKSNSANLGIFVLKKISQQIKTCREGSTLGEFIEIYLFVKKFVTELFNAHIESRYLGLMNIILHSEGNISVCLLIFELGQSLKGII